MEIKFVVLTKPKPKVTLTQRGKWGKKGEEWKRLQNQFLDAFFAIVTKEQQKEIKKWEHVCLRFVFVFKKTRSTKYACSCGKGWETRARKIVCPTCKKSQPEKWGVGQHGDTTNCQKQYEDFLQATGLFNDRVVMLTQSEICLASDQEGILVVMSPHELREFNLSVIEEPAYTEHDFSMAWALK